MKKIKSFEFTLTNAAGSKGQFTLNDKIEKSTIDNEPLENQGSFDADRNLKTD